MDDRGKVALIFETRTEQSFLTAFRSGGISWKPDFWSTVNAFRFSKFRKGFKSLGQLLASQMLTSKQFDRLKLKINGYERIAALYSSYDGEAPK